MVSDHEQEHGRSSNRNQETPGEADDLCPGRRFGRQLIANLRGKCFIKRMPLQRRADHGVCAAKLFQDIPAGGATIEVALDRLPGSGSQLAVQKRRELFPISSAFRSHGRHPLYTIRFARRVKTENGTVLRAITDRPVALWEFNQRSRTRDRPLSLIEIHLDEKGEGEGTLVAAAELSFDENRQLQVTSTGTQPFQLTRVRPR